MEDDLAAAVASAGGPRMAGSTSRSPTRAAELPGRSWRSAASRGASSSDLNILGTALTIKQAALAMKERGGSIVAISSVEGFKVAKYMAPYTVTKAAVESLVRCAALELAPFKIRVNCIQPGYVPTEANRRSPSTRGRAEHLVEITPLRRPGSAEEIGDAVRLLLQPSRVHVGDGPGSRPSTAAWRCRRASPSRSSAGGSTAMN